MGQTIRMLCLAAAAAIFSVSGVLAQDVTEGELNAEMRFQGGQHVFHYDWQTVVGDVTCDGYQDRIAGYVDLDNPEGVNFFLVVTARENGDLVSEAMLAFFDDRHQDGLCGDGDPPPVLSLERFTPREARVFTGIEGACPLAIKIDDGMCDVHRYFWVPDWEEDRKLVLVRN
ncbi:hypothetical protein NUH88_11615 [Nisaea acidiphila]|uniref:Lipoprotein n=1 Tax=Nisaea acidiphila TaxID=1862145 RepID=A0A9J7AK71_9PROT|nr:hypothetical protein [Nisaea acidiphila]UUX48067.1 hypothetical protein NUH88_11615 [Nisaea acidiphila]